MKGRYVQLKGGSKNNPNIYDRNKLIEGYTNDGRLIPSGGVILENGTLAGYIQKQDGGNAVNRTWSIIGKIDYNDPNIKYVPTYKGKSQGGGDKYKKPRSKRNLRKIGGDNNFDNNNNLEKPVSLKSAVNMLREYYRNNFN